MTATYLGGWATDWVLSCFSRRLDLFKKFAVLTSSSIFLATADNQREGAELGNLDVFFSSIS